MAATYQSMDSHEEQSIVPINLETTKQKDEWANLVEDKLYINGQLIRDSSMA